MSTDNFKISTTMPATMEQVFKAWLSSEGHTLMTGSKAEVNPIVGGEFKAWDGYIWGETLEMDPSQRIVQTWRTTEFPESSPDSKIEIVLEEAESGTKITLSHTQIPKGQADSYKQGWEDHYFTPMREYFK
ncbi:MAG: SRPBCC domain-containing protein [Anaerolineae bacterium]|nr:SRPBCC domain-containing protein [Anaerolineae bacterium]MDK1080574.1 SRPBCC domain-containing protein [Anaerolineae bacterium]MDK1117820.1 SRPBCC domain-containing protein [Anaerolineae bacterium]